MTIRGLMAGAIVVLSLSGHAEVPSFTPPSDTDLHAAYCVGTEEQEAAWESAAAAAASNPATSDFHWRTAATAQTRLQRLHHYLDRRLAFIKMMDIDAATKRGSTDEQFIAADSKVHACADKCRYFPINGNAAALKQCMAPCDERLSKIWSCKNLSWLP
jgi:hypothetical protein